MPFSYSTMRQRCENGQVVPEYRFIMARYLLPSGLAVKISRGRSRRKKAQRTALVAAKIAPQPVTAARARHQRQIGRGPEPVGGVLPGHGDVHHLADLLGGKQQVVLDLLLGEPDVSQPVVG